METPAPAAGEAPNRVWQWEMEGWGPAAGTELLSLLAGPGQVAEFMPWHL